MPSDSLIFYNIFISLIIGLVCWINFIRLSINYKGIKEVRYFSLLWLPAGLIWIFVGIGAWFYWKGFKQIDYQLFYLIQLCIAFNPPLLILYVTYRLFGLKKITKIIVGIISLAYLIYFILILIFGFTGPTETPFGPEYTINRYSIWIFKVIYPGVVLLIYLLYKQTKKWLKTKREIEGFRLIAIISIVIYTGAGYFEEVGLYQYWQLFLVRLLLFISVCLAYLAYNFNILRIEDDDK